MDYELFYAHLFRPIEKLIGPFDPATIMAIIGFDCGGPLSFRTVGGVREQFVTYVSCELAVSTGQKCGDTGPFEVMMSCDDQKWAMNMLTKFGRMSFQEIFEDGHTVDIGEIVGPHCPLQGLVVEEFARILIEGRNYGILRLHGVTRAELEFAMKAGVKRLIENLKEAGIYPRTSIQRKHSIGLGA